MSDGLPAHASTSAIRSSSLTVASPTVAAGDDLVGAARAADDAGQCEDGEGEQDASGHGRRS